MKTGPLPARRGPAPGERRDGGQPDNYALPLRGAGGLWHDVPREGRPMTSRFRGVMKFK
ncbi:MAG TPA: hypothetical protein PK836_09840 [Syntrophales bacterium]|nr:hypothetical protein [Syntrophales bacterium]